MIRIRDVKPDDIRFVLSSWKQSWRVSPWAGVIRNDEYFASIQSTIDGLIARGAKILVAVSDSDRILGWCCYEVLPDALCCIHYVYVKDPFLKFNIGPQLVDACEGVKPGLYTFHFRQVVDACEGYRHAPEVARRK